MLKNRSKILVVMLLIMIIISITGTSRAADYSCKVSLLGNKSEVKKGDSVTFLVKVTNIQAGEGIASFNGMLEYDSNVFECTVSGDDEGNWQKQGLVENSLSMTRSDLVANSSDQTIAKIVLKAKSDAAIGKQTFKLTKMEFSTGDDTFTVADVSASITIADDTGSGDNNNNNNDNNNNNNNDNNNNNNNNDNNNNNNNNNNADNNNSNNGSNGNSSSGNGSNGSGSSGSGSTGTETKNPSTINNPSSSNNVIPKTGVTDVLIVGVIIGTIAAVVFYIRYKKAY